MGSANRTRVSYVVETTPGTTPNTPAMKLARLTGENLTWSPNFVDSDELRSDRMLGDPIRVMMQSGGSINYELSYPTDLTFLSDMLRSAFEADWVNSPQRDNAGTADSVITDIGTTANTIVFTTGATFVVGHLVKTSGFTISGNNKIARVTTGGATSLVASAASYTAETVPPAAARVKVVGFQGVSGDITATATGLGSTTLDFTTLGLVVGRSVKIGGTATGDKFSNADLNTFARVTAITATALTLDNLPTTWTTDAGTGKTIKVWITDHICNGTSMKAVTIERGFMDQTTPTYIVQRGMHVSEWSLSVASQQKITGTFTFMGMSGAQGTTSLDASPDAATTSPVLAANGNVSRFTEGGINVGNPNYLKEFSVKVNNNLRPIEDVSQDSPVAINDGECTATGSFNCYFGSNALLEKFHNNTATAMLQIVSKASQSVVIQIPRATLRGGGNPQATGKNTDNMQNYEYQASLSQDGTASHIIMERFEYVEGLPTAQT